jgi:hypothetical protein
MVDIKAAAQHLGIDYADDPMVSANLQRAFMAAQYRLYGSVGYDVEDLMPDDPRVDQLVLIYTEEGYDNHPGSQKADAARNHLRELLETQLRLELIPLREEAALEDED